MVCTKREKNTIGLGSSQECKSDLWSEKVHMSFTTLTLKKRRAIWSFDALWLIYWKPTANVIPNGEILGTCLKSELQKVSIIIALG